MGTSSVQRSKRSWARALVLVGVLVAAFFVAQTCQQSQIRVTKEQAIAMAKERVEFRPRQTQVRLLRQGLGSRPVWVVSLSVPTDQQDVFSELALVKIDANTGEVDSVEVQR